MSETLRKELVLHKEAARRTQPPLKETTRRNQSPSKEAIGSVRGKNYQSTKESTVIAQESLGIFLQKMIKGVGIFRWNVLLQKPEDYVRYQFKNDKRSDLPNGMQRSTRKIRM